MAMTSIQLALGDARIAEDLATLLARSTALPVRRVSKPDCADRGVLVLDQAHMTRFACQDFDPRRIVLITSSASGDLNSAWEAGLSSVVYEQDPLSTIVLAILSACLQIGKLAAGAPQAGL